VLESKQDMKRRGMPSPDLAIATALFQRTRPIAVSAQQQQIAGQLTREIHRARHGDVGAGFNRQLNYPPLLTARFFWGLKLD
jgi:hypothetical protein